MRDSNYIERGNALLQLQRYEQAIEQFGKAVAANINVAYAYQQMAYCYLRLHDNKNANLCANKTLEHNPDCDYAFYVKAFVKRRNKFAFDGREYILKAIEINPNVGFYYGELARNYMIAEAWEQAITAAKTGLNLTPEEENCWMVLINVYHKTKKEQEFEEAVKTSLELQPNSELLHETIGTAYCLAGNTEKGKEHAQALLQINPATKSRLVRLPQLGLLNPSDPLYVNLEDTGNTFDGVLWAVKAIVFVLLLIMSIGTCN